jgi:hypothetical protein
MAVTDTGPEAAPDTAPDEKSRRVQYVDLILGAWRAREAAQQLAAGMEIELGPMPGIETEEGAITIGAPAIDVEAAGDPLINQAWDDACRIVAALPGGAIVVLLAPRFDLPLRVENEWFFHFLRKLGQPVVIIGKDPPLQAVAKTPFERRRSVVSPEWEIRPDKVGPERMRLLRIFPGLMPRAVAEKARMLDDNVALIPAGRNHFLIPTAFRDIDPRYSARDFDALEEIEAMDDGFKAIAQSFCTAHFAEANMLSDLALRHFRWGGKDLALELAARARIVARDPGEVAYAELVSREIALFDRRFGDVAKLTDISPRAPESLRNRWARLKDWAAFASGDMGEAEHVVAPALKRLGAGGQVDTADVRRLNLIVAGREASGDMDGAFTLARSVAAALSHEGDKADRRLIFENAMTLARLHQARNETGAVAAEVERGFATAFGARTGSDIIRMNVMRARSTSDAEAARLAWLRAALAWLGHEPREGLSRDTLLALAGKTDLAQADLEAAIAATLADELEKAWPEIAEKGPARQPDVRPPFVLPTIAPRRLYGGAGAAILWTPESMIAPAPVPAVARLARRVCAGIAALCPSFAKIEGGTLFVDTNLGRDIPATREEALSVVLRARLDEFAFGETAGRLDPLERDRLTGHLEVRISPIVDEVIDAGETVAVTFKRYLTRTRLSGAEARLVDYVAKTGGDLFPGLPPALGYAPEETEKLVRKLEKAAILRADMKPA